MTGRSYRSGLQLLQDQHCLFGTRLGHDLAGAVGDLRPVRRDALGRTIVAVERDAGGEGDVRRLEHARARADDRVGRSEEHTSELQSLMRISYAVLCLKKKTTEYRTSTRTGTQHNS